MPIQGFDHVALPARNPEALITFYKRLGFPILHEDEWRSGAYPLFAVQVGAHAKINFHSPKLWQDPNFDAKGPTAQPGCGDLCFVFDGTIDEAVELIEKAGAEIAYGPIDQPGGGEAGSRLGTSVYTRDPDENLIEFMTYPAAGRGGWGDS
ncbi:MAG: VOC family protein [Myxococcales bacterium]|nr:VOC family protein [Myxococcales bacterium]